MIFSLKKNKLQLFLQHFNYSYIIYLIKFKRKYIKILIALVAGWLLCKKTISKIWKKKLGIKYLVYTFPNTLSNACNKHLSYTDKHKYFIESLTLSTVKCIIIFVREMKNHCQLSDMRQIRCTLNFRDVKN